MIEIQKSLPNREEIKLSEGKLESIPLVSKNSLCQRLLRGPEARARFVESHIDKGLAYQLRAMREAREWSQEQLAGKVGMPQTAISRLESTNYGKATITTLKRIARVYDVALEVCFVPFSKFVDRISGTPYLERGLSSDALDVPGFEEEFERGCFAPTSYATNIKTLKKPARSQGQEKPRISVFALAGAATHQPTISQAERVAQESPGPLLVSERAYSMATAGD